MKNPVLFEWEYADELPDTAVTIGTEVTLRDLFAAFALAGNIAHDRQAFDNPSMAASWAYEHADAMLRARAK